MRYALPFQTTMTLRSCSPIARNPDSSSVKDLYCSEPRGRLVTTIDELNAVSIQVLPCSRNVRPLTLRVSLDTSEARGDPPALRPSDCDCDCSCERCSCARRG